MKGEYTVSESGLSSVMRRLVRAVMVFICGAAGYQISKIILDQNWWPTVTLLHPIATRIHHITVSIHRLYSCAVVLAWAYKIRTVLRGKTAEYECI